MTMIKKIIAAESYAEANEEIFRLIRSRTFNMSQKHIILVPDKYTLYFEERLFGGGGAFDIEVLTFSRLSNKLCTVENFLTRRQCVMIMRNVIEENAEKLTCFGKSAKFKGFAEKMYDTVALIKSNRLTRLGEGGAAQLKMKDINLLISAYDEQVKGAHIDLCGKMEMLTERIPMSDYFENANVYIANFDAFTKQMDKAIEEIEKKALTVTRTEILGEPKIKGKILAYSAPDAATELKAVAKRIRNAAFEGVRYKDIAVVAPAEQYITLKRIFDEYEIPFYIDYKYNLKNDALFRFIDGTVEAAVKKYRRRTMIVLAKNYYSGVPLNHAMRFENYCNKFAVDYLGFLKPFDGYDDPDYQIAEGVRARVMEIVIQFEKNWVKVRDSRTLADALDKLLDDNGAEKLNAELSQISPYGQTGFYGSLKDNIAELEAVKNTRLTAAELYGVFTEGVAMTEVSLLPNLSDTVTVGEPSVFRGRGVKYLFIISFNDGILPAYTSDSGLITDGELKVLESSGQAVEPTVAAVNLLKNRELWQLMASSDKMFLSRLETFSRPSDMMVRVLKECGEIFSVTSLAERLTVEKTRDHDTVARFVSSRAGAEEIVLRDSGGGSVPFASSVLYALGDSAFMSYRHAGAEISQPGKLFFTMNKTNVSELEEYFSCPYKHFLKYGIMVKERESGEMSALDVGGFLHRAIEKFVGDESGGEAAEVMNRIVNALLTEKKKYLLKANFQLIRGLRAEAVKVARVIRGQIEAGSFVNFGREIGFGEKADKLKSFELDVLGGVRLKGLMDRVDLCGDKARLIDYKTGKAKLSMTDLYYGTKIQLFVYLEVLRLNGYVPTGAFYFPLRSKWSGGDHTDYRLNGIYLHDLETALLFDKNLERGVKSEIFEAETIFGKDGLKLKKNPYHSFSEGEIRALCGYACSVSEEAAREILEGYIKPVPALSGKKCACDYCEYIGICGLISDKKMRKTTGVTAKNLCSVMGMIQ